VTAIALGVAAVLISSVGSHAFHSWLKQRERERLSATDRAVLEKRFEDFEKWKLEVKMHISNGKLR
jgi:hypothetical protein